MNNRSLGGYPGAGERGRGFIHSRIGDDSMKLNQGFMTCAVNGVWKGRPRKGSKAVCVTVEFHLMQFSLAYSVLQRVITAIVNDSPYCVAFIPDFASWIDQDAAQGWNCP
jgi:hypothetical protein